MSILTENWFRVSGALNRGLDFSYKGFLWVSTCMSADFDVVCMAFWFQALQVSG